MRRARRQWSSLWLSYGALAWIMLVPAWCLHGIASASPPTIQIDTPMPPPEWALLERQLLSANTDACRLFHERYFDRNGFLLCVERWGGNDGPDDAIECCAHWPLLYALGGGDDVLTRYRHAWEGHLRQFTLARTTDVEFARDGMYYKEFPVMFDWVHHGEGLTAFHLEGLADPTDAAFRRRSRRFAGFYLNEDPGAPNYDPQHRIIRSLFNGSRGPLLRKATGLDWAGDPIEIENRFDPRHGERTYEEMIAHFKDYNDIVGDHPQNLVATSLATNAFFLTGESKYRDWVIEYVDAWVERMQSNGNILPTNIGLDGTIGGECGGKWYGGVYGWGFSVVVPQTGELAHRNTHQLALVGFGNAVLLTGDMRYVDAWRAQIDAVNANARTRDGQVEYPRMYGDQGWYDFHPQPYAHGARQLYYWSQQKVDRQRLADDGWLAFLEGENPEHPVAVLRSNLEYVRRQVAAIRADRSAPDTRLADDPLAVVPVTVGALTQLTLGGLQQPRDSSLLHARVRYFDPESRRAGLPPDVAALVEGMTAEQTTLTLVNTNPVESRRVTVQSGGYGEHPITAIRVGDQVVPAEGSHFEVALAAGAGAQLTLDVERYGATPTLAAPWSREREIVRIGKDPAGR